MATMRKRGNTYHYTIRRKALLPRPVYMTFDEQDEGDRYVAHLESLLDAGIVPPGLIENADKISLVSEAIDSYVKEVAIKASDRDILDVIRGRYGKIRLSDMDYPWVQSWIQEMKVAYKLAPSRIKKLKGSLERCLSWLILRYPDALGANPLSLLPRGYATYSEFDSRAAGGKVSDEERDRRLEPGEEPKIRAILNGEKPEGRQRPLDLPWRGALECLFDLALESAMRMREMYTLELSQVDFDGRTIFLEKTKNGNKRQVPMSSVAIRVLKDYLQQVEQGEHRMAGWAHTAGRLFPWWDGREESLKKTTSKLSRQFSRIFASAKCEDLHFHDLRHEATCRLYERTKFSDVQIAKITGHTDVNMLKRYANLRASDMAEGMW